MALSTSSDRMPAERLRPAPAPKAVETGRTVAAAAEPAAGLRSHTSTTTDPDRLVPAVERAARVLDALAGARQPRALAELARELELPRSSLHGLLATLVALDLARRVDDGFTIGPRSLRWADAYGARADVLRAFEAQAAQTSALAAETLMLATLEGADVVYLACRPGSRALAVNYRVGGRFPAAFTSSGKAMLASLSDDAVRERIGQRLPARMTRHSVGTMSSLMRQLHTARQAGHSIDDEETAEGMQCFGAPIVDARGPHASSAVAVSVIKAGLTPRRRAELIGAVRDLARRISTQLGAADPAIRVTARSSKDKE